jgi:hypothetical protein
MRWARKSQYQRTERHEFSMMTAKPLDSGVEDEPEVYRKPRRTLLSTIASHSSRDKTISNRKNHLDAIITMCRRRRHLPNPASPQFNTCRPFHMRDPPAEPCPLSPVKTACFRRHETDLVVFTLHSVSLTSTRPRGRLPVPRSE